MGRLGVVLKSWWNALLGKTENPGLILDAAYEQYQDQLVNVRKGVADVATQKFAIERMVSDAQKEVNDLGTQAEDELKDGNEELAMRLLERKAQAQIALEELVTELKDLQQQQDAVEKAALVLDDQVSEFGRQKNVKKALYRSTEAQVSISESMAGISDSTLDVGRTVARMDERQKQMEARAKAIPELVKHGVLPDLLGNKTQLDRDAEESKVRRDASRELTAMKERLGLPSAPTASEIPEEASKK